MTNITHLLAIKVLLTATLTSFLGIIATGAVLAATKQHENAVKNLAVFCMAVQVVCWGAFVGIGIVQMFIAIWS
jgi:hypothetical protein